MGLKRKDIQIKSVGVHDWMIPLYANQHIIPYGTLLVRGIVDGVEIPQYCKTRGDKATDHTPQYIVYQGQRFKVHNKGTMYSPKIELERWDKEKIGSRWMYV